MGISVSEKDVHTNLESGKLNDQLLDTLKNLDIRQMTTDTIFVVELDIPAVQPIKFEEYQGQSYKHAKAYEKKKTFCGSQIPQRNPVVAKIVGVKYKVEANSTEIKTTGADVGSDELKMMKD
ncbi:hypothetical protein ACFX13_028729 [Malus domestica]